MAIFHLSHTDLDGYGAQFVTNFYFDNIKFFNSNYGKEINEKFAQILRKDISQLELLYENLDSWDKSYLYARAIEFARWPSNKILSEAKEKAKEVRDEVKKKVKKKIEKIFTSNSEEANKDILDMYDVLSKLKDVILEFDDKF